MDTYMDELVEIFLMLLMKAVQVNLINGTTLQFAKFQNILTSAP